MVSFLQSWEKFLAILLVIVFFLLNLSIASRSPQGAWMDEVFYVDPGLNLAVGKGWTATVSPWQTDREAFVAGSPLYPLGLWAWVKVFGISMVTCRAYCYFLFAVGSLLLWVGTYRFHLLTPAYRLFWIVFSSSEYAMNWMARNERYDVWIFVGLALAWVGASLRRPLAKYLLIFLGLSLVPFAGFVGLPYLLLLAGLILILSKMRFWKEVSAGLAGAFFGLAGTALFYFELDSLQTFRESVASRTVGEQVKDHALSLIFLYPLADPAIVVLICLLVALSVYFWINRSPASLPWLGLGWGMIILMPCAMLMRGVFLMMYFYMLIIPLSLALLMLARQALDDGRGRYLAIMVTAGMALICLAGLPGRLYFSWKEWDFRDPRYIRDFVHTYIHPDDSVLTEFLFYFELRDYAKFTALPMYVKIVPPDEAATIDVALIRDNEYPDLARDASGLRRIGGGWKKIAVFPTPEMLAEHKGARMGESYTLYRRDVASPEAKDK
jgi:hypothetical protein